MADVSAASATFLWNILPDIASLPAVEGFLRLEAHFLAALTAYRDGMRRWYEETEPTNTTRST